MSIKANISPRNRLELLVEQLESGEAIPDDDAKQCAALLRDALDNEGRIELGRSGRPSKERERIERAEQVAWIRVKQPGTKVAEAVAMVAYRYGVKPGTVQQDYKKFGKLARQSAKIWNDTPRVVADLRELQSSLAVFENADRSKFTKANIDEVLGSIRAGDAAAIVKRIDNCGIRRDRAILDKILADF